LFAKKLSEVVRHLCASLVTCGPGTYRITKMAFSVCCTLHISLEKILQLSLNQNNSRHINMEFQISTIQCLKSRILSNTI